MKRKISIALMILAISVLITSCGGKQSETATTTPQMAAAPAASVQKVETTAIDTTKNVTDSVEVDEVFMALGYDLSDLSPWSSASAGRNTVLPLLYDYMAYYDSTSENGLAGILMKDFKRIDSTTVQVSIYDYIYDSAGNHMTANDIAWSFMSWKERGKSVKCKLLESCIAIDDYTVEIKLTTDTVGDLENMLCGLIPIVTKAGYEASGDGMIENVISTSHYKVADFVSGSNLTVAKRDDYWQKDALKIQKVSQANAKKITYKIITEGFQVPISLETNTIDISSQMSLKDAARFAEGGASAKGYKVSAIKDTNFYWITFNCAPGALFDGKLDLRQAVCYAIDKNGLITGVLGGGGELVYAYANQICVDYNSAWNSEPYYDYNAVTAKDLVKQSGFDASKTIRLMIPNATIAKTTAQIVQSYLLQIGLKCEILSYDSALFQTYKSDPAQWDIMIDSKMSVDYATSLASTFQVSGKAKALNFVEDPKLQEMVVNVVSSAGHTPQKIDEYMHYLKDQAYVFGLFVPYQYYAMENTVSGVFTNFKSYLLPNACTYSSAFTR